LFYSLESVTLLSLMQESAATYCNTCNCMLWKGKTNHQIKVPPQASEVRR